MSEMGHVRGGPYQRFRYVRGGSCQRWVMLEMGHVRDV